MKKSTKELVESIMAKNEDKIIEAVKKNDLVVGINTRLYSYDTVVSLPMPGSRHNSYRYVITIESFKTDRSARNLAKEVKAMIMEQFGQQ